ncbi:LPXTG cell wall anchor domain-containing protein, partial [Hutsoniella sourekii]
VTPGTNVDGPITVIVEDPDLPGGKVEIEVPVNGHEKGRDDNGSDAKGEDVANVGQNTSSATKSDSESLPETGEAKDYALFSAAALSVLAGLGLVAPRRKED